MNDPMVRRFGARDAYEAALRCLYGAVPPPDLLECLEQEARVLRSVSDDPDDDAAATVTMTAYREGFIAAVESARTTARFATGDRAATTRAMVEQLRAHHELLLRQEQGHRYDEHRRAQATARVLDVAAGDQGGGEQHPERR